MIPFQGLERVDGVVGDVLELLPVLTEKIKARKG